MCVDSKSFGLTDEEYQFMLDDIDQAIEERNRNYGYGNIAKDGNHYPFYDNDKRRKLRSRPRKYCIEEVAIARGLIKIHRPDTTNKKADR